MKKSLKKSEKYEKLSKLRKLKAQKHHLNFIKYVWNNPSEEYVIGFHTKKICAVIDEAIELYDQGISSFLIVTVPYRHGKSEIISRKLPSHFLGLYPDGKVLLSGHTASLVEGMSRNARDLIKTELYQELFPGVSVNYVSSSVRNWRIHNRQGECFAGALLSSISGQGYHLGILDDFCGSREDAESQGARDKMWEGFTDNFMARRAPVSITIILATRWHTDDIIGRIEKEMKTNPAFPRFQIIQIPAFSDEYPSGVLFPERFPVSWYEEQRATLGSYGTASLLQCNPVIKGGNFLNVDNIQLHKSVDEYPYIQYYRVWDLAHTAAERTKSDPDYTSGTLLGIEKKGSIAHLWIMDVNRFRLDAPSRDTRIVAITESDGPHIGIAVENTVDAKDAVGTLQKILEGKKSVTPIEISSDKIIRAYPLEAIFKAGNVHVLENVPWLHEWIAEIAAFPSGKHDDQVDNLSAGYQLWEEEYNKRNKKGVTVKQIPFGGL